MGVLRLKLSFANSPEILFRTQTDLYPSAFVSIFSLRLSPPLTGNQVLQISEIYHHLFHVIISSKVPAQGLP